MNQNLIAIGWEEMGDLSAISTSCDAYKEKYIAAYPDAKKGSIATSAGMLYRFVHEVQEGDYVVFRPKLTVRSILGSWRVPISMRLPQHCILIAGK